MSAPGTFSMGDRVRFEVEGELDRLLPDGRWNVSCNGGELYVPAVELTKVVPPIAVGDTVDTDEKADQLPEGSIVARQGASGIACQKRRGRWQLAGLDMYTDEADLTVREIGLPVWSDCVVLRVGGGDQ